MWLHITPEKQEKSRYERFIDDGIGFNLPEMKCSYLFEYLLKIGAISYSGKPLSWQDLDAWVNLTGIQLNVWELEVIYQASAIYANQMQLSKKVDAPMPERIIEQDQQKLAKHIKSILR